MKILSATAGLAAAVDAVRTPSSLFSNPADTSNIPSRYESAVIGRRVLALSKLSTLATVFAEPSAGNEDDADTAERRPAGLGGVPVGLMDYYADCEDEGNPTLLAMNIATTFRNVEDGSNLTLSVHWTPPYPPSRRISLLSRLSVYASSLFGQSSDEVSSNPFSAAPDPAPYSAANLPRFALLGYLERINPDTVEAARLARCFVGTHRDAKWWLPGNVIHSSHWARLVVTQVYFIGGFGDRAYIGWLPVEEWNNVTKEEWSSIKLPGEEKGWSEWAVDLTAEL